MKYVYPALIALTLAAPVAAEENCAPIDIAARILQSANPNDLHPDWTGENRIGQSWSLMAASEEADAVDDAVTYLKGTLVDPRGDEFGEVYAVKREWSC
jgi:hypothetical protein